MFTSKGKKLMVLIMALAMVLCLVLGFASFNISAFSAKAETLTKTTARYVDIDSVVSTSTSVFQNSKRILPYKSNSTAVRKNPAIVLHVPDDMEGTATITATNSGTYSKKAVKATAVLGFRLIQYSKASNTNKVIYPLDGSWKEYSDSSKTVYPFNATDGIDSITVSAGDRLYFVFTCFNTGGGRETDVYLSLNITHGDTTSVWKRTGTAADCSCYYPADDIEGAGATTTNAFYGGTYKYSELVTNELMNITDLGTYSADLTEDTEDFNFQPAGWCSAPAFNTDEDGTSYVSASNWSVYESNKYIAESNADYKMDVTFRRNGGSFGVYFDGENSYSATKDDKVINGYILHLYSGYTTLYNGTNNSSSWFSKDDPLVMRSSGDYVDNQWHTLSITQWKNKIYITIDGNYLTPQTVYEPTLYANNVYTETSDITGGNLHFIGSRFDLKDYSITWFDYTDAVAEAQFNALKSLQDQKQTFIDDEYSESVMEKVQQILDTADNNIWDCSTVEAVQTVNELPDAQITAVKALSDKVDTIKRTDYDEISWENLSAIIEDGFGKLLAGTSKDEVNTSFLQIISDIDNAPHKYADEILGYYIQGEGYNGLYSLDTDITDEKITSATKVLLNFEMKEGASIRLSNPTGLRYTMLVETASIDVLKQFDIKHSFGILIGRAEDITVDGVVDTSLLTPDANFVKLDIPATATFVDGENTVINGAIVNINQDHFDWDLVGRGYIKVEYADGSTVNYYTSDNENLRSVKDVAHSAFNDLKEIQDDEYKYETENGYSRFSKEERDSLVGFFNNGQELPENKLVNPDFGQAKLHLLDVNRDFDGKTDGSANCFVITYGRTVILFDSGRVDEVCATRVKNYIDVLGVKRIDHLFLSHAHEDHVGGMANIINNYDIGTFYYKSVIDWDKPASNYYNYYNVTMKVINLLKDKVNSDGIKVKIVEPNVEGQTITIDETTNFKIYNCTTVQLIDKLDYNYYSMEMLFTSGTAKAFFGGDCCSKADEFVVGKVGKVDVYTMQHHGTAGGAETSAYSSSILLDELQPTYSVATGNTETPKDALRAYCEKYGQVMNTFSDGHLVFEIIDGKFVFTGSASAVDTSKCKTVNIQSTVMEVTSGASSVSTSDGNKVLDRGVQIKGGKTTSTAVVMNVPKNLKTNWVVDFYESNVYNVSGAGVASRLRIVLNDKVVYPANGDWVDLTNADTNNRHGINVRINVSAGDRLYLIIDGTATVYATFGCRIGSLWFDATNANHLNKDNDTAATTKNFFNGTLFNGSVYTRAEILTYEQVVVTDVEELPTPEVVNTPEALPVENKENA